MKRILFLAVLMLTATQAWTANVDERAAQAAAYSFLTNMSTNGKMMVHSQGDLKLAHVEMNIESPATPVYYIFNVDRGFVIVAGDDRARQILAYGDRPLDVKRMPENMKNWLNTYKRQMMFLQANPDLEVEVPNLNGKSGAITVPPMLTAMWDQAEPYWNHCPIIGTDTCYTGCPATSLSMVFYYWKYPVEPTPEVPAFNYG